MSSVMGVCCDKTAEASITGFFKERYLVNVSAFSTESFTTKVKGDSRLGRSKLGWAVCEFASLYLGNGTRQSLGHN